MRPLWRLEVLTDWYAKQPQDKGEWLPFVTLAALTLALEAIVFLYITGALRPLSAL